MTRKRGCMRSDKQLKTEDGRGYPDGLKGTDIPEEARIIAVADAYDAMTSNQSYRRGMDQLKSPASPTTPFPIRCIRKESSNSGSLIRAEGQYKGSVTLMIQKEKHVVP